jgi:hypothetical protein
VDVVRRRDRPVPAGGALCAVSALAGIASLVVRLRRSSGLQRRQVVVFLVAAGAVVPAWPTWQLLPAPLGHGPAGGRGGPAARSRSASP